MNSARNYVLTQLQSLNQALTTSELANRLNLSRSVVSHYLNELEKEGQVHRTTGRPIKWTLKLKVPQQMHLVILLGIMVQCGRSLNKLVPLWFIHQMDLTF
ncbi:ArsR family transcriptional regulator [Lactobacillus xujianguonis]|uniref:ArsR family transcriptional regulator n=1 Tax=Lactobacillus TaxID=1578 RepID=UPI00143DC042